MSKSPHIVRVVDEPTRLLIWWDWLEGVEKPELARRFGLTLAEVDEALITMVEMKRLCEQP
jgi:hypothetical protein